MKMSLVAYLRRMALAKKLRLFAILMLLPLVILAIILLYMMYRYNTQYNLIVRNVTVVSEFNVDFKKTLDNKVYLHIINGYQDFEQYAPFDDINQARAVVKRLQESTTRPDSLTRLRYILHFLDNLEKYVEDLKDRRYDYYTALSNWDINVRGLTTQITEEMNNYIYYETQQLADLQQRGNSEIQNTVLVTGLVTGALIVVLWIVVFITSNSITKPLKEMCENIKMVGEGDFTVRPVTGSSDEIQTLSASFDQMVQKINELVVDVREKQESLVRTELQLLQAQINPHFLYNTFDTIIWLAEDNQNKQVVEITTSLSIYFRTTLSKGRDFISLQEEELHVRSYLEIQQVRYRDILAYEIDIPASLYHVTLPKLTLQPLVENALYHGIKHRRGMGKITIAARKTEHAIVLEVCDNGVGMDDTRLERVNSSMWSPEENRSFGCANVHKRIRLSYGEPFGVALESIPGIGTKAIVTLPVKENKLIS